MKKEKINSIIFKAQKRNNRNIIINGIEYEFMSYMSVDFVISKLERDFELTQQDKKEIEMLW